ncbi:MAG TPA: FtsX-like permease family protein [Candidatus Bathyarchaeia archaeon]
MSETAFPVNDLLRRKLQTALVLISLTLCVSSTLFLLLFSEKIGLGILTMAQDKLTPGFSSVFSQFIIFLGFLIFIVGGIIVSFMVFVMMAHRIRDIGLMKAMGCPNDLIFGYFITELLIVTFAGCLLGVALGIVADFAAVSLLGTMGFQFVQQSINLWLVILVFGTFFACSLIFGLKPILDTSKLDPAKAISPTYHLGLSKEAGFDLLSKSGLTLKVAMRNLFRRKSATLRIIICLTTVFILITVAIAGGIIADQTTKSWVEKAIGRNVVLIAHQDMRNQYERLISSFFETEEDSQFDYLNESYFVSNDMLDRLSLIPEVSGVDARLVLKSHVMEIRNYTFDSRGATITIGDDREADSIIVGIEPNKTLSKWFAYGRLLGEDQALEAVVGDSLGRNLFSMPLAQSIRLFNSDFAVVGVCLDPVNNGNVTYVPLKALQNVTGLSEPNMVMIEITSENYTRILNEVEAEVKSINSEFEVVELNGILEKCLNFLGFSWSLIMFVPLFSLASASLCLIAYVMLAIAEQRQEFGVLRAVGAKPNTIVKIVSAQSLMVLLSSCAIGIAFGTIITMLILVPKPLITPYTIFEIAGLLLAAFAVIFLLALYPAVRFAKKPILEILS